MFLQNTTSVSDDTEGDADVTEAAKLLTRSTSFTLRKKNRVGRVENRWARNSGKDTFIKTIKFIDCGGLQIPGHNFLTVHVDLPPTLRRSSGDAGRPS